MEGDDIFDYSYRLAEKWGIGQGNKNNGILIYAAIRDRKVFIQNGRGVEGAFTDVSAGRIIRNVIAPNFKNKQYGKGLNEATDAIIAHLEGEFVNDSPQGNEEGIPLWVIILVIVLLLMLFRSGGNDGKTYDYDRPGSRRSRPPIWIGGGGFGGSSGGGFSGGGFGGGFGGGSFGGGGAGGSW